MASSKTSPKKRTTKKTLKGSGGLKGSNKLSWKKMALFAIPVALIGGFLVFRSNAASGQYPYFRGMTNSSVSGGKLVRKDDGTTFREVSWNNSVGATMTRTEFINSKLLCAHYLGASNSNGNQGSAQVRLRLVDNLGGIFESSVKTLKTTSGYFCIDTADAKSLGRYGTKIYVDVVVYGTVASIDTFYGTW